MTPETKNITQTEEKSGGSYRRHFGLTNRVTCFILDG